MECPSRTEGVAKGGVGRERVRNASLGLRVFTLDLNVVQWAQGAGEGNWETALNTTQFIPS